MSDVRMVFDAGTGGRDEWVSGPFFFFLTHAMFYRSGRKGVYSRGVWWVGVAAEFVGLLSGVFYFSSYFRYFARPSCCLIHS